MNAKDYQSDWSCDPVASDWIYADPMYCFPANFSSSGQGKPPGMHLPYCILNRVCPAHLWKNISRGIFLNNNKHKISLTWMKSFEGKTCFYTNIIEIRSNRKQVIILSFAPIVNLGFGFIFFRILIIRVGIWFILLHAFDILVTDDLKISL